MIRFKTTVIIVASISIVASYRNEDLKRFMGPDRQRCWNEVVFDIRSPLTNVGRCFYPSTLTVPPALVPDVFTNRNSSLPEHLFDPLNYAYYVLGIVGSEYYTMSMYKVSTYPDMPLVKSRGLDVKKAKEIIEAGNDNVMRGKYVQFCGIQSSLRPILSCLGNTIASLTRYYEYYCPLSHYQDIQLGIELSKINWALYAEFCDELFVCSSTPVKDCIGELNSEYPLGRPDNFMYSTCMISANFESKFVPCIRKRTEHCPGYLRGAYAKMIYRMQKSMMVFAPSPTLFGSLCRLIQQRCQRHQDWLLMGDVADQCFQPTYDMNQRMGGDALKNMTSRFRYYSMRNSNSSRMLCQEITGIQSCIQKALSDVLPCYQDFSVLIAEMLSKIFVMCDALHLDMMSHTTRNSTDMTSRTTRKPESASPETTKRATMEETPRTAAPTTETTPENRVDETDALTTEWEFTDLPITLPPTSPFVFETTVPWWRRGLTSGRPPIFPPNTPVREILPTTAPQATTGLPFGSTQPIRRPFPSTRQPFATTQPFATILPPFVTLPQTPATTRRTPATTRRTPATVRQAPITVRLTTRPQEQEQASSGRKEVLMMPCLAYLLLAVKFLL